jgi:hypothetical protein
MAERGLARLLAGMEPVLWPRPYGFAVVAGPLVLEPFATGAEAEGLVEVGISCNGIAGGHHDHRFVQRERRLDAKAALRGLSDV